VSGHELRPIPIVGSVTGAALLIPACSCGWQAGVRFGAVGSEEYIALSHQRHLNAVAARAAGSVAVASWMLGPEVRP
jgi:hypothetical protein